MSKGANNPKPESILVGVNGLIDIALGFDGTGVPPRHRRRSSCRDLRPLTDEQMWALLENILARIGTDWELANETPRSRQNWRFEKRDKPPSPKNKSREVLCERGIVSLQPDKWADAEKWVNQVPVASGLTGSSRDKRRCIDLVRRLRHGEYDFVELKIGSDTPLYAAMEVLVYGLLYIFWRCDARLTAFRALPNGPAMLEASAIHLIVAAPAGYYEKHLAGANGATCDLGGLAKRINAALIALLEKMQPSLEMDFAFRNLEDPPFPDESLYRTTVLTLPT
jgi:hypothetical protein